MVKPNLVICGDVHSKVDQYLAIVKKHKYSIQLGDYGFCYDSLDTLDPNNCKLIFGNHDNYDKIPPHSLGDYGPASLGGTEFFFIRGANSPDKHLRREGVSWWRNEELDYGELMNCISLYSETKPNVVLSHTCPKFLIPFLGGRPDWGSRTEVAMEQMWSIHQPKMWYFAHFHRSFSTTIGRTYFRCLNELETFVL